MKLLRNRSKKELRLITGDSSTRFSGRFRGGDSATTPGFAGRFRTDLIRESSTNPRSDGFSIKARNDTLMKGDEK